MGEQVHLACCLFMMGLIWFVQVVHYPLFARVGEAAFQEFHHLHSRLTTYVVAPVMLLELLLGAWLWSETGSWVTALGLMLLLLIWASTAFWQVPIHNRLAQGQDLKLIERLVKSNWLRTWSWTLRSLLFLCY